MREPAYIAIADDGHITLFWGNGTEDQKYIILRGGRAPEGQALVEAIEEMKLWAEENGYEVIVPAYDLTEPPADAVEIDVPEEEIEQINLEEVNDLLDDLYVTGDYSEQDGQES
jgi:hypothetical protein